MKLNRILCPLLCALLLTVAVACSSDMGVTEGTAGNGSSAAIPEITAPVSTATEVEMITDNRTVTVALTTAAAVESTVLETVTGSGEETCVAPETVATPETTEEVIEIKVPDTLTDLVPYLKGEDKNIDIRYHFPDYSFSDLVVDSKLSFVQNPSYTMAEDGLSTDNTGWNSVGFTQVMTLPYTATARFHIRDNTRTDALAAIMLGVRVQRAGHLFIDSGLWFLLREDGQLYAYVKDGFTAKITDDMPANPKAGVDVRAIDDGETVSLYIDNTLVAAVTIRDNQVTLLDAESQTLATCAATYVAADDSYGHVRTMTHFANASVESLWVLAQTESVYTPDTSVMAFKHGYAYAFSELAQYPTDVDNLYIEGVLLADAADVAAMLGYEYEDKGKTVFLTREGVSLTFTVGTECASVNGTQFAFPTVIRRTNGTVMLAADVLAEMMGHSVGTVEDITYIAPDEKTLTEEKMKSMKERYQLYEDVIYNYDDIEIDQTGTGRYKKTPYDERLVGIAYTTWHRAATKWGEGSTWDLPLDGPYLSDDREVIYKHGVLLAEADVDFVFVDWSNNTDYDPATMRESRADFRMIEEATDLLFEIWKDIPNAPKICIFVGPGHNGIGSVTNGNHGKKVDQVYNNYVNNPEYADMYFYYDGKPLLICYGATPNQYGANPIWTDSRFTVRWMTGYVGQAIRAV